MTEGNFTYKTREISVHGAGAGRGAADRDFEAVITGLVQERRHVEVPETIGGFPVAAIAPHAFAEQAHMRSLSLPKTLRSVGAFAFHNCPELEEISLHDSIHDFHNGVVRQDRRLRRIRMRVHEGNYTVMRDILSDTDAKLQFSIRLPDGEVRLLFPGYDYAFNENTMARTIQFSISGSGMVYRECVRRKGIGFREYDRLFAKVIPDDPHAAAEIAADRLLFPYDLAGVHADAYDEYLRDNAADALRYFVTQLHAGAGTEASDEAYMRLQLMAERGMITAQAADDALQLASALGLTRACSIIVSGRETAFREDRGEQFFSLKDDDFPAQEDNLSPDEEDISAQEDNLSIWEDDNLSVQDDDFSVQDDDFSVRDDEYFFGEGDGLPMPDPGFSERPPEKGPDPQGFLSLEEW